MGRQTLDLAAVLGTADRRAPAELGEGVGEAGPQHVRRIHPSVVLVRNWLRIALLVEIDFLEVERVNDLGVLAIRQPRKAARHRQRDEPGVLRITETPPLRE